MKIIKTVYLAGRITGDQQYRSKFRAAAHMLGLHGYAVVNPATLPPEGFTYEAYIRISSAMLEECTAVCFLGDWKDSPGARLEREQAETTGKEIFYYDEWKEKIREAAKERCENGGM